MENFILLPTKAQKRSSGFNQYAEDAKKEIIKQYYSPF